MWEKLQDYWFFSGRATENEMSESIESRHERREVEKEGKCENDRWESLLVTNYRWL